MLISEIELNSIVQKTRGYLKSRFRASMNLAYKLPHVIIVTY